METQKEEEDQDSASDQHPRPLSILRAATSNLQDIEIFGEEIIIGRHPNSTIVINDKRISANHLKISTISGIGQSICDLSTNGTFVNGVMV
ncbi:MAG: hypothetical protein EZS28_034827 [Streblomastix strix]|uniref:FHA domain-containing protein n=1 Tax=Streblomastix strix TaxID=222440 RepID=A0A5J4UJ76_9EUKA|nr:MAG: hypothetical protein EZS28_034827 [Streblomastix strix]